VPLRASDRIVFFGDSITEQGEGPTGYVSLIRQGLSIAFPGVEVLSAGVSGNKVLQLQERLSRDVLSKRPTVVVVYIGINDVWHFEKHATGTPRPVYESGLRSLVSNILKSGIRVILCTPSVIGERRHGENHFDAMLDDYTEIARRIAGEFDLTICDLREAFFAFLLTNNPENRDEGVLTVDDVHLNEAGNRLVADTILGTLTV
jgi:lysophospholipase L1-like esterase